MKIIDEIDKRIIFRLDQNSRIAETQLAKIVGRSKESVRYRIKQLEKKGIIKAYTIWIDPTKLGYQTVKIYLTFANKPKKKKEFIEFVKKDKRLFWFGIAQGSWNGGLTYFVKSNLEFFKLKNELFSRFEDLIIESKIGSLVSVHYCPKKFLSKEEVQWKKMLDSIENNTLDQLSISIINELFKNSRVRMSFLSKKYKVSIETIKNRMKALEKKRIINRYTIEIDFNKLNIDFYKTFLYFKNLTNKDLNKLMEFARKEKNIIHIVKQISSWDIELEIMCNGYKEYNLILNKVTEEFSNIINKVETSIIIKDYTFPAKQLVFELKNLQKS
jgi:DNA-binding Lrp family transcriptional regulator